MSSRHRFTIVVEVNDQNTHDDPSTWDQVDLLEAIEDGSAVITEVDDHEVFE